MTYTFTYTELRQLLGLALDIFTQQDGVYDFSEDSQAGTIAIEEMIKAIENDTKRLENSLPLIDDDYELLPFSGRPVPYEAEDNISPEAIGLESPF